jgi:hypothetical protein
MTLPGQGHGPPGRPGKGVPPYVVRRRTRKLLVVSNCQTFSVVHCMQAASDCLVDGLTLTEFQSLDDVGRAKLADYEVIFAIPSAIDGQPAEIAGKCVTLPHIYFPAFHPDLMHDAVRDSDQRGIVAPTGNSAIVVGCFLHGLDVVQTQAMFRADVFARLGYLECWDVARDRLLDRCRELGYAAEEDFFRWCAQGCFMYTANHPRLFCVMDYAVDALRRAGIAAEPNYDRVSDSLQLGPVFPVYDEIAAGYGLRGSYRFKPAGTNYTIGLADYIEVSFRQYGAAGNLRLSRFDQPMVDRVRALLDG